MRIGVMLRSIDEKQGIGIYTQNLMDHLLRMDRHNLYFLYYRDEKFLGRYADHENVRERIVKSRSKLLWDQVKIPLQARRDDVDVIFHTKFTVPFLTRRKTVMSLHGASWFVHPEFYSKLDIFYVNRMMPWYCKKADKILSNSQLTTDDFIRMVKVSADKLHTAHLAAGDQFRPLTDPRVRRQTQVQYNLPDRFLLSVVKYDPRKNVPNLLEAFRQCRQRTECKLVIVGADCERYRTECRLHEKGIDGDVTFLGWIDNAALPVLYSMAEFLFFPSVYEEFGIPTVEAMACGTPVVVSKTGALPELAADAGLLVNPHDPAEMADALYRMWTDDELREDKRRKAIRRGKFFRWDNCARITLDVLESLDTTPAHVIRPAVFHESRAPLG